MVKFPDDYRPNYLCVPSNVEKIFQAKFFYPNMCHICHCLESATMKLKRCSNCNMISYCGREHQVQHWSIHKEFCRVVAKFLKSMGTNNLFGFMRTLNNPIDRLNKKAMLMITLRKEMNRDIYDFENQMLLYPRMCEVCFETDPNLLVNCRSCPQASSCTEHQHDKEICFLNTICYSSDFYFFCDESCKIIPAMKYVLFHEEDNFQMPKDMFNFLEEYIYAVPLIWMDLMKYNYWIYVCSEFFTKPLTMMYALEELKFQVQSTLTVHIIGLATSSEYEFLSMETILHLLPQLKVLNIILISPNLIERIEETSQQVNVCSQCVKKGKSFSVTGYKMNYSSYVNSRSFKTPDIIVSYDFGDLKNQLWDQSLLKMKRIPAPFLVTNNTLPRACNYQKRMDNLFNYLSSNVHIKKNPFSSAWPFRNAADDLLNLQNRYFSVYTLYNIDRDDQTKKTEQKESEENKDAENKADEAENVEKNRETSDAPNTSNPIQEIENLDKNSDPEKSKKNRRKKKKKNGKTPDVSRPESPNNNASKVTNDSNNDQETEIVDLTFHLSIASNTDSILEEGNRSLAENHSEDSKNTETQSDSEMVLEIQIEVAEEEIKVERVEIEMEQEEIEEKTETKNEEIKGKAELTEKENEQSKQNETEEPESEKIEASENKTVEVIQENESQSRDVKRKKKKKPKKLASSSTNVESAGASGLETKAENCDNAKYLFGDAPPETTIEQLAEKNRKLFVNVEQLAEELRMLNAAGMQTAKTLLIELADVQHSLENIEDKIMNTYPEAFN